MWPKLREVVLSTFQNRKTVVPSGHAVGKTYISAKIAICWLLLYPHSKVITTAPRWEQVKDLLWGEIRKSVKSSPIPIGGTLSPMQLWIDEDWFAKGLSAKHENIEDEFGATKMQGYHSPHLLEILDEAPGIHEAIIKSLQTLTAGDHNHTLAIGNPIGLYGHFYKWEKSRLWNTIRLSCLDHPNVITGKELVPGAVTRHFIKEYEEEYGIDSPIYRAKILGIASDSGHNVLIPYDWTIKASERNIVATGRKALGVDVARSLDGDKTAMFGIHGQRQLFLDQMQTNDTMKIVGKILVMHHEHQFNVVGIDDTGVGGGVVDRLKELLPAVRIVRVIFGGASYERDLMGHKRFFNLKAQIMWELRQAIKPNSKEPIQLLYNEEMAEQAAGIKWETHDSTGSIKIQSKKDTTTKSPDIVDAAAIALYALRQKPDVVQSESRHEHGQKKNPSMKELLAAQKERKRLETS